MFVRKVGADFYDLASGTDVLKAGSLSTRALMVSSMATGALGLVLYWMIAERMLPTSEVGRASAMISTATAMSSLAVHAGRRERFLPVAAPTTRLILGGYALIGATSSILGTGFDVAGVRFEAVHSTTDKGDVPLMVLVLAYYAITDPILIDCAGHRRSAKNVFPWSQDHPAVLTLYRNGNGRGWIVAAAVR